MLKLTKDSDNLLKYQVQQLLYSDHSLLNKVILDLRIEEKSSSSLRARTQNLREWRQRYVHAIVPTENHLVK